MTGAERLARALVRGRAADRNAVLVRALILLAGAVALLVAVLRPFDYPDMFGYAALAVLLWCVLQPDSPAALLFIGLVGIGWAMRAPGTIGWDTVVIAIAFLLLHLASAFAGQLPEYAAVAPGTPRRWVLPATTAAGVAVLAALAAELVRDAGRPGTMLVTVAAIAGLTGLVWYAASWGGSQSDT